MAMATDLTQLSTVATLLPEEMVSYNPSTYPVALLTRRQVVLVSINYRLGTFGFLALNETGINGNFGIGDQVTALQWVSPPSYIVLLLSLIHI